MVGNFLTLLDELESITEDALVASEQKTTVLGGLSGLSFVRRNFRSEWDTTTNDTTSFCVVVQITTRVSLAEVGGKGAPSLSGVIIGEGVIEVVVTLRISTQDGIILGWCQIHWCA